MSIIVKSGNSQKDSKVWTIEDFGNRSPILHYDLDYDTTQPEDTIRDFVSDIRGMLSRYEGNKTRIVEIEAELCDIEHYIEIAGFMNVPNGYKMYRKIAELRMERRKCKNENDLLQPVYEHFHATQVLDKLKAVQGEIAKCKDAIDGYYYRVRTDVLDTYLEPKKKDEQEERIGLNLLTGETEAM